MTFKFSGHETFPCRYTWLPKAHTALESDPNALSNDEHAMISLGVGKNMVRAIRFWVQVAGVAEPDKGGSFNLTDFGRAIFFKNGFDPLGLSPNFVDLIFDKLIEINKNGTSILLVEQNARMALEVCQRGYVFEIGSIALEGEKNSLIENKRIREIYLGE